MDEANQKKISEDTKKPFFVAGGTLYPDIPSYIKRPADKMLLEYTLSGDFCYILTTRQMGKSSLMIRTAKRLREQAVKVAVIDLTTIGTTGDIDTWYIDLLTELVAQLQISTSVELWWEVNVKLGQLRRFVNFLRDVILAEISQQRIVIFIDEIDTTLRLSFRDDFFAAIRSLYNARADTPAFRQLTFVLIGVASPIDLIADPARTPFNIGQAIPLQDFSQFDISILQAGLEEIYPEQARDILRRVYHWTEGHPYLTQKLCLEIANSGEIHWTNEQVDHWVEQLFLSEKAHSEPSLQFAQDWILTHPQSRQLLVLYRNILKGESVEHNDRLVIQNQLQLSGLVKVAKGRLYTRNEIYHYVFDLAWAEENIADLAFFVAGGTLRADIASYVMRDADDELYRSILESKFSYVFAPPQMGKSSLMVRTNQRMQSEGIKPVAVYLSDDKQIALEEWYRGLAFQIKGELRLSVNLNDWWTQQTTSEPSQCFIQFLSDVVLNQIAEPIVIFVDDIDILLNSGLQDNFLVTLQAIYDLRTHTPSFNRITFVLIGTIPPSNSFQNQKHAPLTTGTVIGLSDFSRQDAQVLSAGWSDIEAKQRDVLFERIFYWTQGHPYLTQKLCLAIEESDQNHWTHKDVDELVQQMFLLDESSDSHLKSVEEAVLMHPQSRQLLALYKRVHTHKDIHDNKRIITQQLKQTGLVTSVNGVLRIRNKIYQQVFGESWRSQNLSTKNTQLPPAIIPVMIFLVLLIGGLVSRDTWIDIRFQSAYIHFHQANIAEERLSSLVSIFRLPQPLFQTVDYDYEGWSLFHELPPEEQLALFNTSSASHKDIISVIDGVYITLGDVKGDGKNDLLLTAMFETLEQLDQTPDVSKLKAEIGLWLSARRLTRQGLYAEALEAYNGAISIFDENPATLSERAKIYIYLSEDEQALNDLNRIMAMTQNTEFFSFPIALDLISSEVKYLLYDTPKVLSILVDSHNSEYVYLHPLIPSMALAVEGVCREENFYENNDNKAQSCEPLLIDKSYFAMPEDHEDWFSFCLVRATVVTVTITNYPVAADGQLFLYEESASGKLQQIGFDGRNGSVMQIPTPDVGVPFILSPGIYHIRIYTHKPITQSIYLYSLNVAYEIKSAICEP